MNDKEDVTLWIGAFRYYLGRMSYAVGDFCDLLISAWPDLPVRVRLLITNELNEAFRQDDVLRRDEKECLPLGMDCDRSQWERVRKLWIES